VCIGFLVPREITFWTFLEVVEHTHTHTHTHLEIADEVLKHIVTLHDAVVHFIADLTDGCSAITACCLTPRCSVSLSRKFRAGIVPDSRLFLLQSVVLCRECGTFDQEELWGNSRQEFGPGDNLSCTVFTLDIKWSQYFDENLCGILGGTHC
jgi:hypothetical protein